MGEWIRGPVIGCGSSSSVSLCFSPASGEVLAVKSAHRLNSAPLQKESELLSKLNSPYVVEYRGCKIGEENGRRTCDLFMEYAPRGTLRDEIRLRGGRLKESEIRGFVHEILLGLEYVHGKGIVHCDIKAENILITDGGLKIADFGCAKVVDDERVTAFAGTPAYMSPEVARQDAQSYAADVWSVGCTVIEMAMGCLPWMDADDPVLALYRIGCCDEVPEPPRWLTEPARDFVRKCLIWDPKERPSVKELLKHQFLLDAPGEGEATEPSGTGTLANDNSPNGVLELRLWESMERSMAKSIVPLRSLQSPTERMEELTGGCGFPGPGQPDWGSEDGWITVRAHRDGETADNCNGSNDAPENVWSVSKFSVEDSRAVVNDNSSTVKEITVISDAQEADFDPNEDDSDVDCCQILCSIISSYKKYSSEKNKTCLTKLELVRWVGI